MIELGGGTGWIVPAAAVVILLIAGVMGEMRIRRVRKFTEEWVQSQDGRTLRTIRPGFGNIMMVTLYEKSYGDLTPIPVDYVISTDPGRVRLKNLKAGTRYVVVVIG